MSRHIHNVTEGERWTIIHALNCAAEQYDHDAEIGEERLAQLFYDQATEARRLAVMIEEAASASVVI